MYFSDKSLELANSLVLHAASRGLSITSAESCTGGLIGAAITEVPGASDVFKAGFITYANSAKAAILGVPVPLLDEAGAVSEAVARAMAEGALMAANADLAVSATGIAGPVGGTEDKPVGLVHIAAARTGCNTLHVRRVFKGDRQSVREQTVETALALLLEQAETPPVKKQT
ncbi:MAG: CinA family protein [Alphaproteobacteria bacterium]|jgi:nicotinamide-nucleotide amidase